MKRKFRKLFKPTHIAVAYACVIGVAAGSGATILGQAVGWLGSLRLQLAEQYGSWAALPVCGAVAGLVAGCIVQLFPNASGSGIPQVKASIVGGVRQGMDLVTATMKLLGGIISLGSGFMMGREGPTVHVGAAFSNVLCERSKTPPQYARQLVAAGAGAGLAAAFNAPLAGVFFVLEELLREISSTTIGTAVLCCFVASVTSHALHGDETVRHLPAAVANANFSAMEIPAYLLLGVASGVLGALFNRCIMFWLKVNRDYFKVSLPIRVCAAGLLTGIIVAALPVDFHNYAGMRQHVVYGDMSAEHAALSWCIFFGLTVIAYGSGAPGGLFAPSLAMGTCVGHIFGLLQHQLLGTAQLDTFALVGMGAMFAAVARVPITAIVIVFEMTQNFNLVLPLMLGCIVASGVADQIYPSSIYDRLIEWSNLVPEEKLAEELAIKAVDVTKPDAAEEVEEPVEAVDAV